MISGEFDINATYSGEQIRDRYSIRIKVPPEFPIIFPTVFELDKRIPENFHKLSDGSLCLGSPLRLQMLVGSNGTLPGFIAKCLIPYLYGYSYKEKEGRLPFGELAHGHRGIQHEYMKSFGVDTPKAAEQLLYPASRPRRKANRRPCPCGSGFRVGKCHNRVLNRLRRRVGRLWFRDEYARMASNGSRRNQDS